MGGLWFMFYDTKISRKNFELINKFSELKSRGSDFSNIEIHQTSPINQFNRKNAVLKALDLLIKVDTGVKQMAEQGFPFI